MKWCFCLFLFVPALVDAQTRIFHDRMESCLLKEDVFGEIAKSTPSSQEFCPVSSSYENLEDHAYHWMKSQSRNRRFPLKRSSFLNDIASISAEIWPNSYFYTKRELKTPKKHMQRLLPKSKAKYGLIDCYAFSIPLINIIPKKKLRYDYREELGGLNLYIELEVTNPDGEKERIKQPVELLSEEQISKSIIRELGKKGVSRNLRDGLYYACAISIQPDPRTFGKKRIPYARVFVVLGAKRLHFIKETKS